VGFVAVEQVCSEYLPLISQTALHSSSSIIGDWYNRPNNGRRTKWTQSLLTARIMSLSVARLRSVKQQDGR
jgi:hypothetical protein